MNTRNDDHPHEQDNLRATSSGVTLRRKGWPVQDTAPPVVADLADGWMVVLDQMLQGWEVADVLDIFDAQDAFFKDWHGSLGDTCATTWLCSLTC